MPAFCTPWIFHSMFHACTGRNWYSEYQVMKCIFRGEKCSSSGGQVQFWNFQKGLVGRFEKEIVSIFCYINSAVGRFVYILGVGIYKHTLTISVTSSLGKAWLSILFNAEHIVSSSINNEHIFTACFMFHNEVTFTTLTVTLKCFPTSL